VKRLDTTSVAVGLAMLAALGPGCSGPPLAAPAAGGAADEAPAAAGGPLGVAERLVTDDGTVVATLDNGLAVIVRRQAAAPVVSVWAFVRAGSMVEGPWRGCGISHLTEHLVAKGAVHDMGPGATAPQARQTSDRVAAIGGQSNASTSLDHTRYYISAASSKTDACIDLIADWMARAEITPADFRREHGVVQRELEMRSDEPGIQLWHAHARNMFGDHPAALPIVGFRRPLAELTLEDVQAYHRRMYVPQNMAFVVVGDVDPEAVLDRARRAFAGFAPGRVPDLSGPRVAPLAGVRRVVKPHREITEVMEEIGFQTIPLVHPDLYPLDVLSYVLSRGQASRLVRRVLRERKLVTSISTSSWTPAWGRGEFNVSFRAAPAQADEAEQAVLDVLRRVAEEGVTDKELALAKRQKIAAHVRARQTAQSTARALGSDYLSTGDVEFSRRYTQRIQAVSAEQVQRAARRYLTFDRMAVTRLVPQEAYRPAAAARDAAEPLPTEMFRLPNGLRVILHPTDAVRLVSMTLTSLGGVLLEEENTNGLGTLMTALTTKRAGGRTAEEIAEFFARAGGSLSGRCGRNTFYWQATVLDDSLDEALEIFADAVCRPHFSRKELDILRPRALRDIERINEDLRAQAFREFRRTFFVDSPYRLETAGRKAVVGGVTADRLAAYYNRHVRAGSSVLAIYGHFDPNSVRETVQELFAALPAGKAQAPDVAPRTVKPGGELHVVDTTKRNAVVIWAVPGMTIGDLADRVAIDVLDTIISGYRLPSGWLHSALRGRRLVYVVHAWNQVGLAPGAFMTYAITQPAKAAEVLRIIREKLARAAGYTPTPEEIDLAINTIVTARALENQSMGQLSMQAALDELYGLGYDFQRRLEQHYRRVTPEDVRRVAQKYLRQPPVVVVTTPERGQVPRD
jgi:zinc protease